jgi:hypothetical protein
MKHAIQNKPRHDSDCNFPIGNQPILRHPGTVDLEKIGYFRDGLILSQFPFKQVSLIEANTKTFLLHLIFN